MSAAPPASIAELLFLRRGLLFLDDTRGADADKPGAPLDEDQHRAFLLELANLGYIPSQRLADRAAASSGAALVLARDLVLAAHQRAIGAPKKLEPMFRRFPDGIPADTLTLWWDRVIVHFLQQPQQPCVLCRRAGTVHVLDPCMHLVCDRCFDGSNYSGCPICNRAVTGGSAFFRPAPERAPAKVPSTTFALIDLGNPTVEETPEAACRALFASLCLRTQAMSPVDVDAMLLIVRSYRDAVLPWLPAVIPVRENRALVFGTLLRGLLELPRQQGEPAPELAPFLEAARPHLTTATDVLRLLAVLSGASPALLLTPKAVPSDGARAKRRYGKRATSSRGFLVINQQRFKVGRLPRPLRRHLLAFLDAIPLAQLFEDMSRHRSRWLAVGEALHPGEYAERYPTIARVFAVLRNGQDAHGAPLPPATEPETKRLARLARHAKHAKAATAGLAERVKGLLGLKVKPAATVTVAEGSDAAPGASASAPRAAPTTKTDATDAAVSTAAAPTGPLRTWASAVETALARDATGEALVLLSQRPGEFLRRFDLLLRRAADPHQAIDAFAAVIDRAATPALVALRAHFSVREKPLAARVFWPKAQFCVPRPPKDTRRALPARVVARVTALLDEALLRRFADKPAFDTALLDADLATVIVPFNERTASRSAVQLSRGSSVALPTSLSLRLFMHWCEPERGGNSWTDLDLSVGFFDDRWNLVGTCAYYQLQALDREGNSLAASSGDYTSAPFPDGASEFVDFDRVRARAAGYRYAVMVVNAYSGLPFSALERATAGVMLLDDPRAGEVFDPRTVNLAFALDGANGIFMPLLVDLETSRLHWLDAYSPGNFAFNNVASSSRSIGRICPALLSYFASGTRPSVLDLARTHAAARCRRVLVRTATALETFVRAPDESPLAFLARLRGGPADASAPLPSSADLEALLGNAPVFSILHTGDLTLPAASPTYALFRRQLTPTLSASDLLS